MTEPGATLPLSAATFESLENELKEVTAQLESPAVPLEKRLELHARAVSLHRRLEATLEDAEKATRDAAERASGPGGTASEVTSDPYEVVRDRLADVVRALEGDDLPLARVVELHGEAQRLAARCDAILAGAQQEIAQNAVAAGAASPGAGRVSPGSDRRADDVPF